MNHIDIQKMIDSSDLPSDESFQKWVDAVLANYPRKTELVIRIVDKTEIAQLNESYRHKQGPTNILSFPADIPENIPLDLLGDLVICAPIVAEEASLQGKPLVHHWAHMVVHGVLHLLGYDHINAEQAEEMETKEIKILSQFNISNPYEEANDI